MLRSREYTTAHLLTAAWFEAGHFGGVKPMQMVAQCIGNRVRLGWGDWHQVLSNLGTYSAVEKQARAQRWAEFPLPSANDPKFQQMLALMDQVYENVGERLVGAGVLWADIREVSSPWFELNVTSGLRDVYKRCAQSATLVVWG